MTRLLWAAFIGGALAFIVAHIGLPVWAYTVGSF